MVRTKVFVGNLSFKTREAELAQEFAAAGPVIGANIITRGPRSLGYGFVEFDSEEVANNAVKIMNKKEIDGRAINVEVAKPREDEDTNGQQTNGASPNVNNSNNTRGSRGRGRGGFRGGFRGRGRGGFRGRGRGGFRRRFNNENNNNTNNTNAPEGTTNNVQGGGRRRTRGENQGQDTRTESKTTLFVANLPFSLDDAGFGKVFADNGLKFKSAHVVQKRNGRSKGFGFAEFDAQEDQQKALQALNGKKVEERELIVKVALTEQQPPEGTNTNNNTNTKKEETPAKKEEVKKEEKK
jgi:RNA recognition motif-containing protein